MMGYFILTSPANLALTKDHYLSLCFLFTFSQRVAFLHAHSCALKPLSNEPVCCPWTTPMLCINFLSNSSNTNSQNKFLGWNSAGTPGLQGAEKSSEPLISFIFCGTTLKFSVLAVFSPLL